MKRNIILLFIVMLGLSWYLAISEAVNNPVKMQEHMQKAAEFEEKGIYVDAVAEYEEALQYSPDDAGIYVKMANAYLNSGNTRKFTSTCEKTAEMFQDDTKAMNLLIEYYIENNYEDKAVRYLTGFLDTYPDNANAQNWYVQLEGSYEELYCRYDEMYGMVNDSMVVMKDGLYGILDARGREIIAEEYTELYPFSEEGYALARKEDGAYFYIDRDAQPRKAPEEDYQELGMLSSKRTVACQDGKYGYLDEEMKPVSEFVWEELSGIKHNTGAGKRDGKWVLIDKKGEAKTEKQYEDVIMDENGFCSAQKCIFVKEGDKYHLISHKGKRIGGEEFEYAKAFTEEGYSAVCRDGKWGFVDSDGKMAIDFQYDEAKSFQNGFAAVCIDGLWGYIDTEGSLIIDARFIKATSFSSEGTAAVQVQIKDEDEEVWKLIQLNIFS